MIADHSVGWMIAKSAMTIVHVSCESRQAKKRCSIDSSLFEQIGHALVAMIPTRWSLSFVGATLRVVRGEDCESWNVMPDTSLSPLALQLRVVLITHGVVPETINRNCGRDQ